MVRPHEYLAQADPRLGVIIEQVGPCRLKVTGMRNPYQALLHAIVFQQLSGKAAAKIWDRFAGMFPRRRPRPELLLELPDQSLRDVGLSRAKIAAARDLSDKKLAGEVPGLTRLKQMDDQEIRDCLTRVRGIGPWTVEMLLIFKLGRPDVLPIGDLGVRKGFMLGWHKRKLPEPATLERHGRRWAPYRSTAAWYLWALVDGDGGQW